ncbi:MAG: SMP-30/gluconolactonase/LRE family protein [Cetobacterium sp.]|uniref:SMP-30/gluconolactonase/LRE family protein n=1 Tax=Cetobacterium sp. TaxID=2071632 RepID=UPI003F318486
MIKKISSGTQLTESPFWYKKKNEYLWLDILEKKLFIYSNKLKYIKEYNEFPSFIFEDEFENLYIAFESGIYKIDENFELEKKLINFPLDGFRCNDGGIDFKGDIFIGRINNLYNKSEKSFEPDGCLLFIENNHINKILENQTIPNGICWNKKNEIYYIDSFSQKIKKYTVIEGKMVYQEEIYNFYDGFPDGMCIDTTGNLWIAIYGEGKIVNLNPNTKEVIREIKFEEKNVTSCTFVGEKLNSLLVTVAADKNNLGCVYLVSDLNVNGVFKNKFSNKKINSKTNYMKSSI